VLVSLTTQAALPMASGRSRRSRGVVLRRVPGLDRGHNGYDHGIKKGIKRHEKLWFLVSYQAFGMS
jgi:hypothetical protein